MSSDLEVLKDIPGYKAILKSVLKSQIQLLIEQLSQQTGEETVILTACIHDGSLSHLGSTTGKGFLEGREEIKSQFLGYCLSTVKKRKNPDIRASPYQRPFLGNSSPLKRKNIQPVVRQRSGSDGSPLGNAIESTEMPPSQNIGSDSTAFTLNKADDPSFNQSVLKYEDNEQIRYKFGSSDSSKVNDSFPSGISHQSHTQTSISEYSEASQSDNHQENDSAGRDSETDDSNAASIKIEPITENDMELEITGVEPGNSIHSDRWVQNQTNQDVDQSGYNVFSEYLNTYLQQDQPWKLADPLETNGVEKGIVEIRGRRTRPVNASSIQVKKYPCKYCGKLVRSRYDLGNHERSHTGEKPYKCSICGRGFTQKCHLTSHGIIHLNDLPKCAVNTKI